MNIRPIKRPLYLRVGRLTSRRHRFGFTIGQEDIGGGTAYTVTLVLFTRVISLIWRKG